MCILGQCWDVCVSFAFLQWLPVALEMIVMSKLITVTSFSDQCKRISAVSLDRFLHSPIPQQ